jgi:hypothetical protein
LTWVNFPHIGESLTTGKSTHVSPSNRVSASATQNVLFARDSFAIASMLPALLRGVIFLAGLAAPFVVALLAR